MRCQPEKSDDMKLPLPQTLPRSARLLLWLAAILAAIALAGFVAAPPLVRHYAQKIAAEKLHRPVVIEEVGINPFALSVSVGGLEVKEPDGAATALRFDELVVNLEVESLFRGGLVLRELRLVNPYLRIARNADGSTNYTDLIREWLSQPPSPEPTHFSLNNIRLTGGRVDFYDALLNTGHRITDIDIGVPFVSNLPSQVDIEVQPGFSAKVDGTPLAIGGSARPFRETREAAIGIDVDGLDLAKYAAYSPVPLDFALAGGSLDAKLSVNFSQPPGAAPRVAVTGHAALSRLALDDRQGAPLVRLAELAVALKSLELPAGKLEVAEVQIRAPEVWLERTSDKGFPLLGALAPRKPAETTAGASAGAAKTAPFAFSIGQVALNDGRLHVTDGGVTPAFKRDIEGLRVLVKNLGNAPDQAASVVAELRTGAGETLRHEGTASLAPLAAQGRVALAGVTLAGYAPYHGPLLPFRIQGGTLEVAGDYRFVMNEGRPQAALSGFGLELRELALRRGQEKTDFFRLARFAIQDLALDLDKRSVGIGVVETRGGRLQARREADGSIDLMKLALPQGTEARTKPADEAAGPPWTLDIAKLAVEGYGLHFEDRTIANSRPIVVEPLQFAAENLSADLSRPVPVKLKAAVNKRGSIALEGSAAASPLKANLRVDLRNLDLLPVQPYLADKLTITLTKGAVSARGALTLATGRDGALQPGFKGAAGITDLHTMDNATSADFLSWKSLQLDGIALAGVEPLRLDIAEVALSDFYSRLIVYADGKLNVQQILREPEATTTAIAGRQPAVPQASEAAKPSTAAGPPQPAVPDYRITVAKVSVQGGNVNFSDFFIKPNYSADMKRLGGSIAGLSSDLATAADVELRGAVSDAPLEILGKVNPLSGNLFLDLKASVKGMELPQFSPYSGKYAGYAIQKGKMSVNVAYKIENRKLEAQNNVYLDQLSFGDKVESPDATKLPVMLAVALLKDRNGVIDVNLPIGGSLDDPEFSVGGVIVRVLVNLIVKAVTAPFALLGSLFGGGEELSYAEFDPGRAAIADGARKKLDALAKALADRPGLKLEIAGRVDPDGDREGLKRAALERKVKAQKLAEVVKRGESVSLDAVVVGPAEYPKYLLAAYKQEKFPKPRNAIGLAKDLPPAEMEKLMLAHAQAAAEDLRQLAVQRAQVVKDYLVSEGKVPDERVFTVAPKLVAEDAKDKASASRVDFSLK